MVPKSLLVLVSVKLPEPFRLRDVAVIAALWDTAPLLNIVSVPPTVKASWIAMFWVLPAEPRVRPEMFDNDKSEGIVRVAEKSLPAGETARVPVVFTLSGLAPTVSKAISSAETDTLIELLPRPP